jgi:hypothetical protein
MFKGLLQYHCYNIVHVVILRHLQKACVNGALGSGKQGKTSVLLDFIYLQHLLMYSI